MTPMILLEWFSFWSNSVTRSFDFGYSGNSVFGVLVAKEVRKNRKMKFLLCFVLLIAVVHCNLFNSIQKRALSERQQRLEELMEKRALEKEIERREIDLETLTARRAVLEGELEKRQPLVEPFKKADKRQPRLEAIMRKRAMLEKREVEEHQKEVQAMMAKRAAEETKRAAEHGAMIAERALEKAMKKRELERQLEEQKAKRHLEQTRELALEAGMAKRAAAEKEKREAERKKRASASAIKAFVDVHNALRSSEGAGLGKVTWNAELASQAQDLVDRCQMAHDSPTTAEYDWVGQNLFWSSQDVSAQSGAAWAKEATQDWYSEKTDYTYSSNSCKAGKMCGHYTQVVWGSTKEIGCAISQSCSGGGTYVACNYGPGGNYMGQKPY